MAGKYKDPDYMKKYKEKNKIKNREYDKKYRDNNKEFVSERKKIAYEKNKEHYITKSRFYKRKRMSSDILYKLYRNIASLIAQSIRRNGYKKSSRTFEILGSSYEDFKLYLESKFELWMTWENRGLYNGTLNYGWDIDHIIPISSGLTEDEIIKLNHYTNLRPLCSKINRDIKRNIMLWDKKMPNK